MKLLWMKAGGIAPLDTGGKIRSFHILKELAPRHQVTLFTFYPEMAEDPHPGLRDLFQDLVLVPLRLPRRGSAAEVAQYLRIIGSGEAYTIRKYDQPGLREQARAVLARPYDAIICDFVFPAWLMDWGMDCLKVLFTHNVEAQVWRRHSRVSSNLLWKSLGFVESRLLERAESRYVKLADHVLTVSEADRREFSRHVDPSRITVIPTGVDSTYFRPAPGRERPGRIVFTGSMDWMPNEDGVAWFASEVWPLIRAEVPEAEFDVVGRRPSRRIQALAGPGVRVTGRVDDIRPYLDEAAVYVVPLRSGSGTRLKIFEAMAAGKPVVSTTVGAEGLPVEDSRNIVIRDSPDEFAASVVRLLRDAEERRRLGQAAREVIENGHSWAAVSAYFEALLADLLEARSPERVRS